MNFCVGCLSDHTCKPVAKLSTYVISLSFWINLHLIEHFSSIVLVQNAGVGTFDFNLPCNI